MEAPLPALTKLGRYEIRLRLELAECGSLPDGPDYRLRQTMILTAGTKSSMEILLWPNLEEYLSAQHLERRCVAMRGGSRFFP